MKLTDVTVRQAKAQDKPYKLVDGTGLYLLVNRAGKYWRYDYRFYSKRKTISYGVYPVLPPRIFLKAACGVDLALPHYRGISSIHQHHYSSNTVKCVVWHSPKWVDIYDVKNRLQILGKASLSFFNKHNFLLRASNSHFSCPTISLFFSNKIIFLATLQKHFC